jgi:photosystem II stability/assembly factor-like uncharacterized protein
VKALAGTVDGVFTIDLDTEEVVEFDHDGRLSPPSVDISLPRLLAAASAGSTVVAVVDARPPLAVSHDAGVTWTEAGGGLPKGRAVAVADEDPDLVLYGARNRLYLSRDGGRFWTALAPELPEIEIVEIRAT